MDQTRPTLTILSWTSTKTTEVRRSSDGSGGTHEHEIVKATFQVNGAADFPRASQGGCYSGKPAQVVRPRTLRVEFVSIGGGPWIDGVRSRLEAVNIKKDDTEGAVVEVRTYDWSNELRALLERDGDNRNDALDWVRSEFPR